MDSLLNSAPAGFLSFSDEGSILLVNDTLLELIGLNRDDLAGRHVENVLAPVGRIFYQTHFFPLLRLHGHAEEIYLTLRAKTGEDVPVLINAVRRDRDGRVVNDCVIVRIHQRRLYEDAILAGKRAAEEANATKEKFLSMMSHDLRTPLQAISGYADFLLQGFSGALTDQQRNDVSAIKNASREVTRMITDILEYARMERGGVVVNLQQLPVADALSRAESMVRLRIHESGLQYSREDC